MLRRISLLWLLRLGCCLSSCSTVNQVRPQYSVQVLLVYFHIHTYIYICIYAHSHAYTLMQSVNHSNTQIQYLIDALKRNCSAPLKACSLLLALILPLSNLPISVAACFIFALSLSLFQREFIFPSACSELGRFMEGCLP